MKQLLVVLVSLFVITGCGPKKQIHITDSSYSSNVRPQIDFYLPSEFQPLSSYKNTLRTKYKNEFGSTLVSHDGAIWASKDDRGRLASMVVFRDMKSINHGSYWLSLRKGNPGTCSGEELVVKGVTFEVCGELIENSALTSSLEQDGYKFWVGANCYQTVFFQFLPVNYQSRKMLVEYSEPSYCDAVMSKKDKEALYQRAIKVLEHAPAQLTASIVY